MCKDKKTGMNHGNFSYRQHSTNFQLGHQPQPQQYLQFENDDDEYEGDYDLKTETFPSSSMHHSNNNPAPVQSSASKVPFNLAEEDAFGILKPLMGETRLPPNLGSVKSALLPQTAATGMPGKGRMKTSFGDVDYEDLKKYRRLSGFTLFSLVNKRKYSAGASNESEAAAQPSDRVIHKKMQELWNTLNAKAKVEWKTRARRLLRQTMQQSKRELKQGSNPTEVHQKELHRIDMQLERLQTRQCSLMDVAAHFKLLGEQMNVLSRRVSHLHQPMLAEGVGVTLLDTLLTGLVTTTALCNFIPGIDPEQPPFPHNSLCKALNNMSSFMPGLQ